MVTSAIHGDETVVCIHDDYCKRIEAAEIAQILRKIGDLVSNAYHSIEPDTEKLKY